MPTLTPGDLVICTDANDHCHFLRLGETYTVDTVRESDGWISLEGFARMWPASQFRLVREAASK